MSPIQGYLVDWDAQKAIWDGMFSEDVLAVSPLHELDDAILLIISCQIDTSESSLLITEPYFNLPNIQEVYDQFVFEEYDFQSYYRCTRKSQNPRQRIDWIYFLSLAPAASLVPRGRLFSNVPHPECVLIVDSGFSFTHIVPIMDGAVLWYAVKRSVVTTRTT